MRISSLESWPRRATGLIGSSMTVGEAIGRAGVEADLLSVDDDETRGFFFFSPIDTEVEAERFKGRNIMKAKVVEAEVGM